MLNNDHTLDRAQELVDNAEQISLSLILLQNQNLNFPEFHALCVPLLEKINSDLQDASSLILLSRHKGGMGDARMESALAPSPC